MFGERRIEDLDRELLVISASVLDGQPFPFRSGPLVDALVASCSIPLMFPPMSQDGSQPLDRPLADVLVRPAFGYRTTYHDQDWSEMVVRGRAAAELVRPALAALATASG